MKSRSSVVSVGLAASRSMSAIRDETKRVEFVDTETAARRLARTLWCSDAADHLRGQIATVDELETLAIGDIP